MPMAASPSASAVATISSGCEAPRRKEKLVVTASSAYVVILILTQTARARTNAPLWSRVHKVLRGRARSGDHRYLRRGNSLASAWERDHATTHQRCVRVPERL